MFLNDEILLQKGFANGINSGQKNVWSINLSTQVLHQQQNSPSASSCRRLSCRSASCYLTSEEKENVPTRHTNVYSPFGVLGHIPRDVNNGVLRRQKLVEICYSSYELFTQNSLMISFLSFLYQKLNIFSILITLSVLISLNQKNRLLTFLFFS